MKFTRGVIFIIVLFSVQYIHAQSNSGYKNLSVKDGLSQGWVQTIIQDKMGYMWFGTNDGLNKYDGNKFTIFQHNSQDSLSLHSSFISALCEDSIGNIWIGTNHGLSVYNYEKDQLARIELGGDFYITNIYHYAKNKLLVSSYFGLFLYDISLGTKERFLLKDQKVETNSNRFRVICPYDKGIITFTGDGVFYFDINKKEFSKLLDNTENFEAFDLRCALRVDSMLWLGLVSMGLGYIDLRKMDGVKFHPDKRLDNNTIYGLIRNNDDLIIGTESNGLFILDLSKNNEIPEVSGQVYNHTSNPMGLISNSVHSFCIDKQDNLWVGTYNGISYSYGNDLDFRFINRQIGENSLVNNMVSSITEVGDLLWLGTEDGIDVFDKQGIKHDRLDFLVNGGSNSLLGKAIMSMKIDDDGNVWAGSWSGGIDVINPERKIIKKHRKGEGPKHISSEFIMSVDKDSDGNMWIGTMGGGVNLYLKDEQIFKKYMFNVDDPRTLTNDWIKAVMVTSKDEVWVSTHTSLELLERESDLFYHFNHDKKDPSSISTGGIISMHEDNNGTIWFGTPSGISRFVRADSSFINYSAKDGLPNNSVQGITCDKKGNLWMSTNAGISKVTFESINNNKLEFVNYDIRDGLIGNEFIRRSFLKTHDNLICFGSKEGLVLFDPERITANTYIPPVIIDRIVVNNKIVRPEDNAHLLDKNIGLTRLIKLKHEQSDITFSFSALNYVVPGRNEYKYRLVGFDDEWKDNGNESTVSYTNIPAGKYVFQVIGSNNSGVWNKAGDEIVIQVLPPWYRSKWAYVAYLIFVFLLVLLYRHFIMMQTSLEAKLNLEIIEKDNLNKINQVKTNFFTNISHEFLTPLTLILSPLETLINNQDLPAKENQQLKPVYRNAKRLQRLINQLLDVSKMESDHLALRVSQGKVDVFIHDIYIAFKHLASQKDITLNYFCELKSNRCYFDGDKIEKILYNLISNAIKFTPKEGVININISQKDNQLILVVEDNGQGIAKEEQGKIFDSFYRTKKVKESAIVGTGVGLSLVNGLVNVYGGGIDLLSEENDGTKLTINLPYLQKDFSKECIYQNEEQQTLTIDLVDEEIVSDVVIESTDNSEGKRTILVVEDNVELNQQLVRLLSPLYNVSSAQNGLEGYGKATIMIPELIISDVVMPQMDGMEFLKKLRENESTSHIPIIMLTAKVEMKDRIDSIEQGADAYITKPFEKKHLEATISNLLISRQNLKEVFKQNITIEPTQLQITSVDEKFITKAIKIVEDNISNPEFTVEMLGQEIGMSRVQLHRKLTALVGMPSSGFIREIKIKRAAELLTKGQLTVSEVMYEINIKSRAYFTKSFKEIFGMLPTEYIKSKKEQP